jgi:hypothetical protein
MAHYPVNHQLRSVYRFLAGLAGVYLVLFGAIGLGTSWGEPFFHRGGDWALGLRTNPAAAVLSLVAGLVILGAALIGGNLHHRVNLILGWALMAYGIATMAVIQTDANILNASMVNVVVVLLLGLAVLCGGLYGKVESRA